MDKMDRITPNSQRRKAAVNAALLIVDIQNDYFPGGNMELVGSSEASLRARELLLQFREMKLPVVHVHHISTRPGATFFLPGTDGVRPHENVEPLPGEIVIHKNFPNSFRNTPLLDHLKKEQVEHLVIAGMMTHMCIDATTRAAFDYGFTCTLAHDACATRNLSFGDRVVAAEQVHLAFLAALGAIYAKVAGTAEVIGKLC
jgi:nicotinamidase-related amidase